MRNLFDRLCLAALLTPLAGCALGGQPASTITGWAPIQSTYLATPARQAQTAFGAALGREMLNADHVTVTQNCGQLRTTTHFAASGVATGVYPGDFTAAGTWHISSFGGWNFAEDFTIASGPYRVAGSLAFQGVGVPHTLDCSSLFRPTHFDYTATVTKNGKTIKHAAGDLVAAFIQNGDFRETLR